MSASAAPFIRTPLGLSNQFKFMGVDLIVFSEGGSTSYAIADIESGAENGETHDAVFWRTTLEIFAPMNRSFHIKTVGSKTSVRTIAAFVASGHVLNVLTVSDRDLDHHRGNLIHHANVLYTRAYSWENDVWTVEGAISIYKNFVADRRTYTASEQAIRVFFSTLERCFQVATRADKALAAAGRNVVSREALEDSVRVSPPDPPQIRRSDIASAVREARKANPGLCMPKCAEPPLDELHGHTLARAVMGFLRSIIEPAVSARVSNNLLISAAVTNYGKDSVTGPIRFYKPAVEAIVWGKRT